jgi:formylglycine-generating enzyme
MGNSSRKIKNLRKFRLIILIVLLFSLLLDAQSSAKTLEIRELVCKVCSFSPHSNLNVVGGLIIKESTNSSVEKRMPAGGVGKTTHKELLAQNRLKGILKKETQKRRRRKRRELIKDSTPPIITVPLSVVTEAAGPNGTLVKLPKAIASDDVDGKVPVFVTMPPGSIFPVGITTVIFKAKDKAGNSAGASITVNVQDTRPPVIKLPSPVAVEAKKPGGAIVRFEATAIDVVDGEVRVVSNPPSGSLFPIGKTTVIFTAKDRAGNVSSGKVDMTVKKKLGFVGKDGAPTVYIPAGEFIRGVAPDDYDGDDDEKPARKIYLDAYFIDKYPVTNRLYKKTTGKALPGEDLPNSKDDDPVVWVMWKEAKEYCELAGKRLPTEAEWEKAVRGPDGRKYPWGNEWEPNKLVWGWNSSLLGTGNVFRKEKINESPYGVVDMLGNVWEWVSDYYDENYYKNSPIKNPKGPQLSFLERMGTNNVIRGGSFLWMDKEDLTVTKRRSPDSILEATRLNLGDIGFRCAKSTK